MSETLFHFLGNGDDERLFDVFDSIVRRGLLLTVGDKHGKLDQFPVRLTGGQTALVEVMQHARVCFTDIPEQHLAGHCEEYGKFGIGFARKTILSWGGNPVIYMPNYPDPDTLETSMGSLLYFLHRIPLLTAALKAYMTPGNTPLIINQTTLVGADREAYINGAELSLRRMWAFVKEMSSGPDDYQFLYEREWRIVDGAVRDGVDLTRELTDDEVKELAKKCKRWMKPLDVKTDTKFVPAHQHMLQFFRFFNGLAGMTVAQAITSILVPNADLGARVERYLEEHPERFGNPTPIVKIFGADGRWARG
jgi:Putative abortive phage resistance protein AbiGi, antitoxin